MPRYFFNLADGTQDPDEVGSELPDIEAARGAALALVARTLLDDPEGFWATGDLLLTVCDETGLALFTVHVSAMDSPAIRIAVLPAKGG